MSKFISYESWERDFFTIPNLRDDLYHVFEENSICYCFPPLLRHYTTPYPLFYYTI